MPCTRIGRSTSTIPWSKSISMTRSAITHSRPIDTCWNEEIVHSWPSTVLAPIETVPSWLRILHPCPTHDQRPSSTVARSPTSMLHRGPMNASPSSFSLLPSRSLQIPSRTIRRPYFRSSIPWRLMKRSSVRTPPCRGGGGVRLSVLAESMPAFTIALAMTRTVLIVDDHPSFRASARMLLESEGFEVIGEAEDGSSALRAVEALHPDVVLLDVQLPDIDGIEVAARLSRNGSGPAIVLTSSRDLADIGLVRERSPVRGFIPKAELSGAALEALL